MSSCEKFSERVEITSLILSICPKSNSFLFCPILFFLFVLQSLFLFTCQSAFNLLYVFCRRKILWNYTTLYEHITNCCIVGNMFIANLWLTTQILSLWKSHTNLTHAGKYFRPSKTIYY